MSEQTQPSWLRGRGNCCETCVDWEKDKMIDHVGKCNSATSIDSGENTDSRYRCPAFTRKKES